MARPAVLLEQLALQGGPLRVSQPLLVITDPVVSIVLSVWLFGEYFVLNGAVLAAAAAGFCAHVRGGGGDVADRSGHAPGRR